MRVEFIIETWEQTGICLQLTVVLSQDESVHAAQTKHIQKVPGRWAHPEDKQPRLANHKANNVNLNVWGVYFDSHIHIHHFMGFPIVNLDPVSSFVESFQFGRMKIWMVNVIKDRINTGKKKFASHQWQNVFPQLHGSICTFLHFEKHEGKEFNPFKVYLND